MAIDERATVEFQVNGEQARKEMQILEQKATSLKARIVEAQNAGDTKKVKELQKELKETNATLRTMRDNAKNIDAAMNNIGLATPKELRRLIKDINAKLNSGHIARGSAEWKKYQEQLKLVNAEIRKVNGEIKESQSWLTRFNNGFAKWGALAASGAAAITGISMTLNKMRKDRDDKEASAANLKALTGLDDSSIQWLTRQAEILSTSMHNTGLRVTQSSKDILEAYMLVGSAKPDLLGNKEALNAVTIEAMRLSKAAKMDLKEAVDAVTLSMNQYGASADKAAVYTNVMAAGSKFGSAAVQSITSAVTKAGVSASTADVSIEQLVGSIETLAEKGIKDEVAGTGLKMFFLRLQTGADETNPKIVGLQTALKNLQKLSTDEVVKRFGAETYTVAQTLIDGADKVDYYTRAVTGTNVAMEQAAINSATNEARMAQLKNQIRETGIELMEKLNPSLNMLTGWTTKFIKMAPVLIDWFIKYKGTLTSVSVALAAMIAYKKMDVAWSKLQVFWNEKVVASFTAMTRFVKANPYAFLIVGAAALIGKLIDLKREQDRVTESQRSMNRIGEELNKRYDEEETKIKLLTNVIHNQNFSYNERRRCIDELKKIVPGYNGMLSDEGQLMNDNTDAIKNYLTELEKQIKLEAAREELAELYRKQRTAEKQEREQQSAVNKANADLNAARFVAGNNAGKFSTSGSRTMAGVNDIASKQAQASLSLANQKLEATKQHLEELKQAITDVNKEIATSGVTGTGTVAPAKEIPVGGGSAENAKAKKERIEKELLAIEEKYALERDKLQNDFLSKRNMTQDEYEQFGRDLEEQSLNEKLEVLGLEEKKRLEIQNKILSLRDKFQKECSIKDKKEYNERQKSLEGGLEQQLDTYKRGLQEQLYAGEINQDEQKGLYRKYLSDLYDEISNNPLVSDEFKKKMNIALSDEQLNKQKESYDKATDNLNKLKSQYTEIGQSFGQSIADFFAEEEQSLEGFLAKMLVTVLDALQKQLIAQQAAAIGLVTIKDITLKGLAGVATAAAKIALITAAFETAKGVLGGFAEGGFTGSGSWDQPQGIVHSNEFVANRFAVANPAIRPVLNLLDYAQRNNTVGSLTSRDVSRALSPASTTPSADSRVEVIQTSDPEIREVLEECTEVLGALRKKLGEPILTYTKASGKMGVNEAQRLIERMNKNASRK